MRVTENRMMEMASDAVSQARDRAAASASQVSSGLRVAVPSDDPVAWSEGMRAVERKTLSTFRAGAISASRQRLSDAEMAFGTIGDVLSQVMELGTEMGNDTHTLADRAAGAIQVRGLRDSLLAAANMRDADGQYVLAGTLGDSPAFDNTGAFVGDAVDRDIQVNEASNQTVSVNGSLLTAAAGVDIYAVVNALATAMDNNDAPTIRAQIAVVYRAVQQVAQARATTGVRMKALDEWLQANETFLAAVDYDPDAVGAKRRVPHVLLDIVVQALWQRATTDGQ